MTDFATDLLNWYDDHARDLPWRIGPKARQSGVTPDPYHVFLSELMLQQTTVATVGPYFANFLHNWPQVADLAAADDDAVMRAWAGLGYYARARNLLKAARVITNEHNGLFPDNEAALNALPGIGPYTAAAIASIAFDKHAVVVDGNVNRIIARVAAIQTPLERAKTEIYQAATARTPARRSGDYAQAMMDLGATICRPKSPNCLICPVQKHCQAYTQNIQNDLPRKLPKKARPERHAHAYILRTNAMIGYEKRPETGLLGGLWGVPTSPWQETPPPFSPPHPGNWQNCGTIRHVFTHFALTVTVHMLDTGTPLPNLTYMGDNQLPEKDLPTLFRKIISCI